MRAYPAYPARRVGSGAATTTVTLAPCDLFSMGVTSNNDPVAVLTALGFTSIASTPVPTFGASTSSYAVTGTYSGTGLRAITVGQSLIKQGVGEVIVGSISSPGVDPNCNPNPTISKAQTIAVTEAGQITTYIEGNGCTCGDPILIQTVKAFQEAYNSLNPTAVQLPLDGQYTPQVQAALNAIVGSGAPAACCGLIGAGEVSPTANTSTTPAASGLSTGDKVAIGAGAAVAVGTVGWLLVKKRIMR